MSKANDNEMTFVLLGRDTAGRVAIRAWIEERIRTGKNRRDDPQIAEAEGCLTHFAGGEPGTITVTIAGDAAESVRNLAVSRRDSVFNYVRELVRDAILAELRRRKMDDMPLAITTPATLHVVDAPKQD